MTSEDNGGGFEGLTQNWRSALVVNSLHDALEETERERDELAERLRYVDRVEDHTPSPWQVWQPPSPRLFFRHETGCRERV